MSGRGKGRGKKGRGRGKGKSPASETKPGRQKTQPPTEQRGTTSQVAEAFEGTRTCSITTPEHYFSTTCLACTFSHLGSVS